MALRQRTGALHDASDQPSPLRRVFTIKLSLLSLVGVSLVMLLGVGWIFAFGVIIGRGFEPEKKVPVLGRLVPQATDQAPEDQTIIKAEDLTFFADLKTQPTLSTEQPSHRPAESKGPDAKHPEKTHGSTTAATGTGAASTAGTGNGNTPAAASPRAAETKVPRYNFVFQVIAYKKAEQAEAFREKLENAGLRTRLQVEKDKHGSPRIYRIQVLLKGTDADADAVRATLLRQGVKDPTVSLRKQL